MTMESLDGNAIGGLLGEIFALETTAALGTCAGCGSVRAIAEGSAYLDAPGAVLRCRACESVLLRVVRGGGRYWVDLRGLACLELSRSDGAG
jgi:phage FluMu protein Com